MLKISIIIPTYNAASFLAETLDSVLSQGHENLEILVIDDGSTDNTNEVLAPYLEKIRLLTQSNWGGPSRPRNVGLSHATGDLVAFFDSDDIMLPGKLLRSVEIFENCPEVDFLFTNFQGIDESGQIIRPDYLLDYTNFRKYLNPVENSPAQLMSGSHAFSNLIAANFVGTSSVVCRRSIFDTTGNLDESMLNSDDLDMWCRIAHAGFNFGYLPLVLHSYRMRPGGVTGRNEKRYPSILYGIEKRLQLATDPRDLAVLNEKKNRLLIGYGIALRKVGQYNESRRSFANALSNKVTFAGIKGWVRSAAGTLFSRS